jgi:hypothetical protein
MAMMPNCGKLWLKATLILGSTSWNVGWARVSSGTPSRTMVISAGVMIGYTL